MSSSAEPLREEVSTRQEQNMVEHTASEAKATLSKGTRSQVVLAGAIAGLVSRFAISQCMKYAETRLQFHLSFVIAPLDVLKIRLQLSTPNSLSDPLSNRSVGILSVSRSILCDEGLTAFWKGNIPAEGLYLSYGAVQFLAYRSTNQALEKFAEDRHRKLPGAVKSFVSGAVAGTAATTATYPLDLLRTRFAAQGTEKVYAGLMASLKDIKRNEGYTGFFRGLYAGIGQVVPNMGLFFAGYETFKPVFAVLPLSSGDAVAGITASILSKSAVFPLDTVRKRLQVQGPTRSRYIGGAKMPVYERGIFNTMALIVRKEGARGLYRGLSVSLVKAAPASAVTMWTYERALNALRAVDERIEEKLDAD